MTAILAILGAIVLVILIAWLHGKRFVRPEISTEDKMLNQHPDKGIWY